MPVKIICMLVFHCGNDLESIDSVDRCPPLQRHTLDIHNKFLSLVALGKLDASIDVASEDGNGVI